MKQNLFFTACAVTTMLTVSFFTMKNKQIDNAEELLFMDNIEALSSSGDQAADPEVVKCYCKHNWLSKKYKCVVGGNGGYCGGDPCSNHDGNCRK